MTKHMQIRMNQRAISGDLVQLALQFGRWNGDRCLLDRQSLRSLVADIDVLRGKALKALDKGGLTVVESQGRLITTYTCTGRKR